MTHRRDPPIWVQIPVLPFNKIRRDRMNEKINAGMIVSVLAMLAGIIYYIAWNVKYSAWTDVGIYTVPIVLISFGAAGYILSTMPKKED